MTAITVASNTQALPNAGIKMVVIRTDSAAASGYTWDATGTFTTIYGTYLCANDGAVKIATWSSLTVTLGTISTGIHTLVVFGV